ncbi:MAG: DNA primase [Pseudomonadota bacterium]
MAGRIPQNFIDELMSRTDIVEVINERVPLKKKGREYAACCPFHDERTPSFYVSPQKQFYHCFGCGAHGTALGFLMDYANMGFVEAVEDLAGRQGLEIPREGGEDGPRPPSRDPLYTMVEMADRWYRAQLREHRAAGRAVSYLKGRGISGRTARDFGLGYAPPGYDNLMPALGGDETTRKRLVETGLLIEREDGRTYDRFRDRILFPIRDHRGRTLGFGGRLLEDGEPKYLNSPETPLFHKGHELYGLYEARQALRRIERLLVVEGYMDVIALAEYGLRHAVATLGTATTADHLQRLFRVCEEVIFCFDGDRAGRDAAWRAVENALPVLRDGRRIRFLFLPDGDDPDTLVRREGREAFAALETRAEPLEDYLIRQLVADEDLESAAGRRAVVARARPLLARAEDPLLRDQLIDELARLTRSDRDLLRVPEPEAMQPPSSGNGAKTGPRDGGRSAGRRRPRQRMPPTVTQMAIAILLQHPELAAGVERPERFRDLDNPGGQLLSELLELLQYNPHLSSGALLEHWRDREEGRFLMKLSRMTPQLDDEAAIEQEFVGSLRGIDRIIHEQRLDALIVKSREGVLTLEEREELRRLTTDDHGTNEVDE